MYGRKLFLGKLQGLSPPVEIKEIHKIIKETHQETTKQLDLAAREMTKFADRKRRTHEIKKGSWVMLSTKQLALCGPSRKLTKPYIGPFRVTRMITPVTAQLEIPHELNIHPTIHVARLKEFQSTITARAIDKVKQS